MGSNLPDPSFYHLDTAFCALPPGDVIYYPGAFIASGRHAIEERVVYEQRIVLDRAEAAQFSANAVSFDHCLVLSSCTDALRRNVEERGFTVLTTPLHIFLRSGGSACCLTLRLDHRSEETNSRSKGGKTTSESLYGGGGGLTDDELAAIAARAKLTLVSG